MSSIPTEEYHRCLRQQFLFGLNARVSSSLIHAGNLIDSIEISKRYLEEMELKGFLRVCVNQECHTNVFGDNFSSKAFSQIAKKEDLFNKHDKILMVGDFLIIKSPQLILAVEFDNRTREDADIFQDLLVIYTDNLEGWLCNYGLKKSLSFNLNRSLQDIIQASQELIEKYISESDELVYDIMARFPTLGLESDQEEMILDIIRDSSKKQLNLLENEIQRNSKFGDILIESVRLLEDAHTKKTENQFETHNQSSVDLF